MIDAARPIGVRKNYPLSLFSGTHRHYLLKLTLILILSLQRIFNQYFQNWPFSNSKPFLGFDGAAVLSLAFSIQKRHSRFLMFARTRSFWGPFFAFLSCTFSSSTQLTNVSKSFLHSVLYIFGSSCASGLAIFGETTLHSPLVFFRWFQIGEGQKLGH